MPVYFGYEAMWTFTFVPIAFVLVMTVGIALGLVYAVGAARGKQAAARYTQAWTIVLLVGGVLDLTYAVVSGQWAAFISAYGWAPVIEMGLLAAMFIVGMWMMAASYVGEKPRQDRGARERGDDSTDA
jgi:hypothetical protein